MKRLSIGFGVLGLLAVVTYFWFLKENQVRSRSNQEIKLEAIHVPFIQNSGQKAEDAAFYAQTFAGTVFVTRAGEIVYDLPQAEGMESAEQQFAGVVLKEVVVGAKINLIIGEEESSAKVSHFVGNDPSKWQQNIATFGIVNMGEVYPGIGLKLRAHGNNVEKIFSIMPDTDPERIVIQLEGAEDLKVNGRGALIAVTGLGDIRFTKPVAYQDVDGVRIPVEAAYRLEEISGKLTYGFSVGHYDRRFPLIIDPLLASTFIELGGSDSSTFTMAIDLSGNVFVAGRATLSSYPTTMGAYDVAYHNGGDVFVSKLDRNLSTLLASTFIGGDRSDKTFDLEVDSSGNVYITGSTFSDNYPTTTGAYDESFNSSPSERDVFISQLDNNLSSLLASTFLGGTGDEIASALVIDSNGDIFITGGTGSSSFPTTAGSYDQSYNRQVDAFVSKLDGHLSTLLASTFLGGSDGADNAYDIVTDVSGNIVITGTTKSPDFPVVAGAYDTSINSDPTEGNKDIFVSKFTNDLSTLLASTFIGGGQGDNSVSALAIDAEGNIFITGSTTSVYYPTTAGTYDSFVGGDLDSHAVFVSKLNDDLSALLASTFIGGEQGDNRALDIAIDSGGNIFITGETNASDYPTIVGSYDDEEPIGFDLKAFVSKLDNNLEDLLSSTFLGGEEGRVSASALALDPQGNVYVVGRTNASDFPTSVTAYDRTYNGGSTEAYDIFLSRLTPDLARLAVPSPLVTRATSTSKIVLTWKDKSSFETGFKLERKVGACSSRNRWSEIRRFEPNITTFTEGGRAANTTYSYRIRASYASGDSGYSSCSSTKTPIKGTPVAPDQLKAIALSSSRVKLTWRDNARNEKSFKIFRRLDTGSGTLISTVRSSNARQFVDARATGNDFYPYSYYVQACNKAGCSPATSVAAVPNGSVDDFVANAASTTSIALEWIDLTEGTGLEIQRKDRECSSINPWSNIAVMETSQSNYTDSGLTEGATYAYRIRSYSRSVSNPIAYGYSQWSSCVETIAEEIDEASEEDFS